MEPDNSYTSNTMLMNMLLTTIVGIIITQLSDGIRNLIDYIIQAVKQFKFNRDFYKKPSSSIILNSVCIEGSHGVSQASTYNYKTVMFILQRKNIDVKRIKEQNVAMNIYSPEDDRSENSQYDIDHSDEIIISKKNDIRIKCSETNKTYNNNDRNNASNKLIMHNITLYSYKLTTKELVHKLNKWKKNYKEFLCQYKNDDKIYYYALKAKPANIDKKANDDDSQDNNINNTQIWRANVMKSYKTFDNIFFTDKNKLLDKINYFLGNEQIYKKRGSPYTLGMLFHGAPGCGKTSCIKAIANLTQRHIMEISLNQIKTCGEFVDIMTNEFIDNVYVPIDKRIILIEDIDCMIDLITDRSLREEEKQVEKDKFQSMSVEEIFKMQLMTNMCSYDSKSTNYKNDDKLTLACILNTIDGVFEHHGRMLIMTTNYVNQLDRALIRPGRIDLQINFTKCTGQMIKDIIEFHFETKIDDQIIFQENEHTPAEVINRCISFDNTIDKVIDEFSLKTNIDV